MLDQQQPRPYLFEAVESCISPTRGSLPQRVFGRLVFDHLPYASEFLASFDQLRQQVDFRTKQGFTPALCNPSLLEDGKGNRVLFSVRRNTSPIVLPDGIYTIVDTDNSEFSYRIKTAKTGKMQGKRLISFHTGTNHLSDFTSEWSTLGHLIDFNVYIWSNTLRHVADLSINNRFRRSIALSFDLIQMLDEDWLQAGSLYALRSKRCFRCNTKLVRTGSILKSCGPTCEKVLRETHPGLFENR